MRFSQYKCSVDFKINLCIQTLKFVEMYYDFCVVAVNINVLLTNSLLPTNSMKSILIGLFKSRLLMTVYVHLMRYFVLLNVKMSEK